MSKGRLEEVIEEYEWNVENQLLPRTSDDNFEWLVEQAERVQELKRANKQLKGNLSVYKGYYRNTLKHNKKLIEQNKRFREAVEFGIEYLKNSDIRQVQLVVTALKSALEGEE